MGDAISLHRDGALRGCGGTQVRELCPRFAGANMTCGLSVCERAERRLLEDERDEQDEQTTRNNFNIGDDAGAGGRRNVCQRQSGIKRNYARKADGI